MSYGVRHVPGHFITEPQLVSSGHPFDCELLLKDIEAQIIEFNKRGSNFELDNVIDFMLIITQYRPLSGSTFMPTPPFIAKKKAVTNVVNKDNKCFMWAILSCLYPAQDHPYRVSNYTKYEHTLNFDGIDFPMQTKQIPKFEKQNPTISVNVISPADNAKGFCVEYLSPELHRQHHVNLLLFSDPDRDTSYYVHIRHFSRLLGGRSKDGHESSVCNSCLNVFSEKRVLDEHVTRCLMHHPQQVVYADPSKRDECKLSFKDHHKEHPQKFYLVCDFECFLTPPEQDPDPGAKSHIVDEHMVSGFCCHRVTSFPQYQTPPTLYSGPNVMTNFYDHVMSENKIINEIMSEQVPLTPMSDTDRRRHRAAKTCQNCGCFFTHKNCKVYHHDHVTGEYLFPACNNCNLQLKPKKC